MAKLKNDIKEGMIFNSDNFGDFLILNADSMRDVVVKFIKTGYIRSARSDSVRSGKVRDFMFPSVYGKGYTGEGIYSKAKDRKAYYKWRGCIQRCYDPKYLDKKPSYLGCSVCNEWLNFQSFAKWFYENYPNDGEDYCLDKDFKIIGNKIYSPESCLFVSMEVNSFITDCCAARGKYKIGASLELSSGKFKAACQNPFTKKYENLGRYNNDLSAHLAWRKRKSELSFILANKQVNNDVRDGILNYKNALDANEIYPY